jgi:predicted nucleic acid-binding protein
MRIYVDACTIIRATEGSDGIADRLVKILELGDPGARARILTSAVTFAEVLTGPLKRLHADRRDHDAERLVGIYTALLSGRIFSGKKRAIIEIIELTASVSWNAADLRARRAGLKLPDAIHIGSALSAECDTVLSDDKRLLKAAASLDLATCAFDDGALDALLARTGP